MFLAVQILKIFILPPYFGNFGPGCGVKLAAMPETEQLSKLTEG